MIAITNINELKSHCDDSPYNEFFMRLNGGFRSSKRIQYWSEFDSWCIFHDIDDTMSEYDDTESFKTGEPMIFEAMTKNAFYKED
jgi:hypothetical protein